MSRYGRYQAPEPARSLTRLHVHDSTTVRLRTVDHEPKVCVLDQQDLLDQGIHCSQFIPGASDVDALGSCTANATTAALSNLLSTADFQAFIDTFSAACHAPGFDPYTSPVAAEEAAIGFYHACTDQTGSPASEWPPTDCGSSGPYIVSELESQHLASGDRLATDADSIVSLMQTGGLLMGSPFFYAWEQPDAQGFIDGKGRASDLQAAIRSGLAGDHETFLCAVERVDLDAGGHIVPQGTVLRARNSWSASWGDHGDYRVHLSTIMWLRSHIDLRQLVA